MSSSPQTSNLDSLLKELNKLSTKELHIVVSHAKNILTKKQNIVIAPRPDIQEFLSPVNIVFIKHGFQAINSFNPSVRTLDALKHAKAGIDEFLSGINKTMPNVVQETDIPYYYAYWAELYAQSNIEYAKSLIDFCYNSSFSELIQRHFPSYIKDGMFKMAHTAIKVRTSYISIGK